MQREGRGEGDTSMDELFLGEIKGERRKKNEEVKHTQYTEPMQLQPCSARFR